MYRRAHSTDVCTQVQMQMQTQTHRCTAHAHRCSVETKACTHMHAHALRCRHTHMHSHRDTRTHAPATSLSLPGPPPSPILHGTEAAPSHSPCRTQPPAAPSCCCTAWQGAVARLCPCGWAWGQAGLVQAGSPVQHLCVRVAALWVWGGGVSGGYGEVWGLCSLPSTTATLQCSNRKKCNWDLHFLTTGYLGTLRFSSLIRIEM